MKGLSWILFGALCGALLISGAPSWAADSDTGSSDSATAQANAKTDASANDQAPATPEPPSQPHMSIPQGTFLHWHNDISRFDKQDYLVWNRGRWFHGDHGGKDGWWWVVGDAWYYYSSPTYPFPDPYTPDGVVATQPSTDTPANNPPNTDTPPPKPAFWYFCESPSGYYPYVVSCGGDWEPVLPTAPR